MTTKFIKLPRVLEAGTDLLSPHLRWLLRHATIDHCSPNAIDMIAYHRDIPKNNKGEELWGECFSPVKAIAINLEKHFHSSVEQIQDADKMYTALRCILIRELLDTTIHEGHHLKASYMTGDYNNSKLEEEEAEKLAWQKSWLAAKHWDAEITEFGPVLDKLLNEFMADLENDTKEKPVMWKDLQVYMWKNQLAFYNPDLGQECKIRETFETMANDNNPWIDEPKQFITEEVQTSDETPINNIAVENIEEPAPENLQETYQTESFEDDGLINMGIHTSQEAEPPTTEPTSAMPPTPGTEEASYEEQHEPEPEPKPEPETAPIYIPPPPPAPTPTSTTLNVLQIQQTIEAVLRTLFAHIVTKCGYTDTGTFTNPTAVLEPVSILHIPHATEIFSQMDTTDAAGVYTGNQPCNGYIKGLVSKQDMPMYRFYYNIGGNLQKRTFIPTNPNKLDANGNLSTWARAVREGTKIVMLLEENSPPKAHLKLEPGMKLGQEEFKIWGDK